MRGSILPNHTNFKCYVYASNASEVDNCKSITGYIRVMISEDSVSRQRRIQTSAALSTMEANPWLQVQRHKKPCDKLDYLSKLVCISKFHTNDNGSSRRSTHTKHSDAHKEFARDAFNKGTIELGFVPTAEHATG
jgi:hypothetical protein